jgi:hypothetical protein
VTRYDLFRRRLAPIALFLGIALIARDSCENERTHATIQLGFGAGEATVRAVDVDVVIGDEVVARFHRAALPDHGIGPCEFKLVVAEPDGEFRIVVDRGANRQQLTRRFHAVEGSTMLVTIPDEPGAAAN